ncbi:OST5 family protein, partial [Sporobolomyces koalae]|uniref:OST5 family protein n=1 Tax=Sporobolomyces koalae TaxID=500713 RepID=UPI0031713289
AEHSTLSPFTPFLAPASLQPLSIVFLSLAFIASFYFSTLRSKQKFPLAEIAIGTLASILGGFGMVLGFCAVGVCV